MYSFTATVSKVEERKRLLNVRRDPNDPDKTIETYGEPAWWVTIDDISIRFGNPPEFKPGDRIIVSLRRAIEHD